MAKMKDITGQKFGRLVVVEKDSRGGCRWLCRCDCGKEKIVRSYHLSSGRTKSCGCLRKERNSTHKMSASRFYGVWRSMIQRCGNPRCSSFKNYGGRGINICERWLKFENFRNDMHQKYLAHEKKNKKDTQIDRIDNNKGYFKNNCKWSTKKENHNNKRNNIFLTYKKQNKTIMQWAEIFNIPYNTLWWRIKKLKWPVKKALTKLFKK